MNRHNSFSLFLRFYPAGLGFFAILLIINSCRKDNRTQPRADPALNQAKTWYESTYPTAGNSRMLITQNTRPAVSNTFDFTQYIKPDWNHAKKYNRLGKNVIELPVDPSGKISSAIKNQNSGKILNPKEHSRSSFILLNDGKNYEAYVMTIIADSDYLKNDLTKLDRNTYQHRDPAFSGLVLYFTPKGQYVNGYAFKNGQQVTPGAQSTSANTSITQQRQLTRSFKPRTQAETIYDCTAWWLMEYDQFGNLTSITFLYYTDCMPESGGGTDSGTSGSPSSAVPPPPPQCQPPSGSGSAVSNNHSLTRVAQQPPSGGGDGGMPPPQTCPTQTTTTVTDTIPPTPCQQATALANNSGFKTLMNTLQSETGQNYENAYTFDIDANGNVTSNSFQGMPNSSSVALTFSGGAVDGYAHDHYAGDMPTFSEGDIQQIYNMMLQHQIKNLATFTAAVVTASGTTYIIKISDPSQFTTFGAANLVSGSSGFKDFSNYYSQNVQKYELLQNDQITSYELGLLAALQGSGLSLFKGNSTFTSWVPITNTNNIEVTINCN